MSKLKWFHLTTLFTISVASAQSTCENPKSYATVHNGWTFTDNDAIREAFYTNDVHRNFYSIATLLKAQGVTLVPLIIPNRAAVVKEYEQSGSNQSKKITQQYQIDYLNWVRSNLLNLPGAIVPDTITAFSKSSESVFFTQDHHWRPEGARLAAQLTAKAILSSPFSKDIESREFKTAKLGEGQNAGSQQTCSNAPKEAYPIYQTDDAGTGDLLGGEDPQIVYVGSSFGRSQFNFTGFLEQELSMEVVNYSIEGGGILDALATYFSSKSFTAAPPKFIVWEMSASEMVGIRKEVAFDYKRSATYNLVLPRLQKSCDAKGNSFYISAPFSQGNYKINYPNGTSESILAVYNSRSEKPNEFRYMTSSKNKPVSVELENQPVDFKWCAFSSATDATPLAPPKSTTADLSKSTPPGFEMINFSNPEDAGFRWSNGPESKIIFTSPKSSSGTINLKAKYLNLIDNQEIKISINGKLLQTIKPKRGESELDLNFKREGVNIITLAYSKWNGNGSNFASADSRNLALRFSSISFK